MELIFLYAARAVRLRAVRLAVVGISTIIATCFAIFSLGQVNTSNASLEVLSDVDCVIEPSQTIELGVALSGLLAESYFDRSDYVSEGELMARLESNVERVALAIAEESADNSTDIELRKLTADFGNRTRLRNSKLLKTATISEQVMDQVSTEARIAKLQVEQEMGESRLAVLEVKRARAALERREIRSPISGFVTERYKSTGEYVDREPVFQVVQLDPLHVEVIVPVDYLGSVESGMVATVAIQAPGFSDRVVEAVVHRIDAVADAASGTFGVRLVMENRDMKIPSGVRCRVDFLAS